MTVAFSTSGPFPQHHNRPVWGTKKAVRTSRPKILCLIEMFWVFFRPLFTTGQPTAYGLPCSSPYFQDLESWNWSELFLKICEGFFCARLGLNSACKHACAVQKCAKYIKHFSILIRDISRCFTVRLNRKENWKLHDVYYLFVSLQNRGYKEMSGSGIWAEKAKKHALPIFFQCFSSLDFVYGTLVLFLSRI